MQAGTSIQTVLVYMLGNSVDFIADDGEPWRDSACSFRLTPSGRLSAAWVTITAPGSNGGYPLIYIYDTVMHSARATAAEGFWPQLYVKPTP